MNNFRNCTANGVFQCSGGFQYMKWNEFHVIFFLFYFLLPSPEQRKIRKYAISWLIDWFIETFDTFECFKQWRTIIMYSIFRPCALCRQTFQNRVLFPTFVSAIIVGIFPSSSLVDNSGVYFLVFFTF